MPGRLSSYPAFTFLSGFPSVFRFSHGLYKARIPNIRYRYMGGHGWFKGSLTSLSVFKLREFTGVIFIYLLILLLTVIYNLPVSFFSQGSSCWECFERQLFVLQEKKSQENILVRRFGNRSGKRLACLYRRDPRVPIHEALLSLCVFFILQHC